MTKHKKPRYSRHAPAKSGAGFDSLKQTGAQQHRSSYIRGFFVPAVQLGLFGELYGDALARADSSFRSVNPIQLATLCLTASGGEFNPHKLEPIMTNPAQNPSAVSVFQFQSSFDVRIITIDGNPWFVAADVSAALDYRNAPDMTRSLDDDETATHNLRIRSENGIEQSREVTIINESGLYSAILKSRKPEAKKFKKWVTSEVLPSIRKTGQYIAPTVARPAQRDNTPCNNAQMREIKILAHDIGQCFHFSKSATQMALNHLRVQFHLQNIVDLPAADYAAAMHTLQYLHSVCRQYLVWRTDSDQQAIALLIQQGQPWTPHITKRLRQELNLQIEGNPDWLQLAQRLLSA